VHGLHAQWSDTDCFSRRDAGALRRLASPMSAAREKQPGVKRLERTHSPRFVPASRRLRARIKRLRHLRGLRSLRGARQSESRVVTRGGRGVESPAAQLLVQIRE